MENSNLFPILAALIKSQGGGGGGGVTPEQLAAGLAKKKNTNTQSNIEWMTLHTAAVSGKYLIDMEDTDSTEYSPYFSALDIILADTSVAINKFVPLDVAETAIFLSKNGSTGEYFFFVVDDGLLIRVYFEEVEGVSYCHFERIYINDFATKTRLTELLLTKQDTLTAGSNITISNNVISSTAEGDSRETIALTGTSGTLSAAEIALVNDDTKNVVLSVSGKLFRLFNEQSNLSYKTFLNIDAAMSSALSADAIYIQLNEEAVNYGHWTLEEVDFPSSGEPVTDYVIKGAGAPTTSTVGTVGKLYEDTTNGDLYQCTEVSGSTYTWEAVGGGGVTPVQTIYGSSTTDVPSQAAIYDLFKASNNTNYNVIKIGDGAIANCANYEYGNIAIGKKTQILKGHRNVYINPDTFTVAKIGQTSSCNGNIVIGIQTNVDAAITGTTESNIVIGSHATNIKSASGKRITNNIFLGNGSNYNTGIKHCIQMGYNSLIPDDSVGVVSFGNPNITEFYNGTGYRLLTGLYDGQSLHDAATLAQGNTLSTTAPTTSTVGVLGQLYTDTTNMHTYQCTGISGGVYTWTQRW